MSFCVTNPVWTLEKSRPRTVSTDRVAHVGGMGGRFDLGDAGRAPGGLRYLVGPLQRGESDVTRGNRHQIS